MFSSSLLHADWDQGVRELAQQVYMLTDKQPHPKTNDVCLFTNLFKAKAPWTR